MSKDNNNSDEYNKLLEEDRKSDELYARLKREGKLVEVPIIIRETNTDPAVNKLVREAFERTKVDLHHAVRFGYVNGRLIGYDFRSRGESWNYPKFLKAFEDIRKTMNPELEIEWSFYYDGVPSPDSDNPNPVKDDY